MAAASNTTIDRYNITKFIKYTEESGFKDYDFYHNPKLFKTIKNLPLEGIKPLQSDKMVRLDTLSFELYETTSLWWLLAIYNDIPNLYCSNHESIKYPSLSTIESWYFTYRELLLINEV